MGVFLLKRVCSALVLVWIVSTLTFCAVAAAPGTPQPLLQAPTIAPPEQHRLAHALGLDQSIGDRYGAWLTAVLRGDWGSSFTLGRPVTDVISSHLPASTLLGFTAVLLALSGAVLLALFSGRQPESLGDRFTRFVCLLLYSTPPFWLGALALWALSFQINLFPPGNMHGAWHDTASPGRAALDILHHLALPSSVLGLTLLPVFYRTLRASILETLESTYVRAARARGLSEKRILLVHVLPNAVGPTLQILGLSLPAVCGGVLITEVVFSWPGMGRMTYTAMLTRDLPLVVATTTLVAIAVVLAHMVTDIATAVIDPRVMERD